MFFGVANSSKAYLYIAKINLAPNHLGLAATQFGPLKNFTFRLKPGKM